MPVKNKPYRLLRWINLLLILVTLLAYLAPNVSPATFWPLSFVGLLYPWLLLGNILCIIGWLMLRRYYFLFSLGCLLLGWSHFQSYVGLHFASPVFPEDSIRAMTFNCYGFRHEGETGVRLTTDELPGSFPLEGMDIICFQEFPSPRHGNYFVDYIKSNSPLKRVVYQQGGSLAIFSRFPVKAQDTHYFPNRVNGYQYADLEVDGRMIRLFNIHLQSNSVAGIADQVAKEGANLQDKKTWMRIRGMMGRYKRAAVQRVEQAEEIAQKIKESPYPVLLCGDFNEIPQSYAYHILSQGLQDAFKTSGKGLGISYNGTIPALRIDYVMAGPEFKVLGHRIGRARFSDHFPVYGVVRLVGE
ncbi:MAG: endonuclease/exonuclease/phosphatase family protein [Lewinellaceae bacterium]|nr:endonuclease/exonuclease/phosphatase family protein [Phaeodactylibacter sp.]MCB0612066.1 endonuclease/exonuclease/phosphatase family protein [Phaeodactylibacter sp.]MCB9347822.1 endonuclease/exonuclease/phosphatase family protein [Lewinellaceae bacterium]